MRDDRIRFSTASPFHRDLRARVGAYFKETGRPRHGGPGLRVKTILLVAFTGGATAAFLLSAGDWWQALVFGMAAGLGVSGIGFAVQHDASHGAYSSRSGTNRLMAAALDAIGGSSHVWRFKHNQVHHTYPNLAGVDQDVEAGLFGRLAPAQPRRWIHRYQHLYLWAFYALLTIKWMWFDDVSNVIQGKLGSHRLPRPRGAGWLLLFGGKLFAITWSLVLPVLAHGVWMGLLFHLSLHMTSGLVLSVIFQLAHCVEEADFPEVPTPDGVAWDFAAHQVRTSVDFARSNRLLTWYIGGLNFQAVHHLFPRICHQHYPALSPIVAQVCAEHGIRYRTHDTFLGAVRSHYRWLREMGTPEPASG